MPLPHLPTSRHKSLRPLMTCLLAWAWCAGGVAAAGSAAEPVVFWASDPVRPGETVMIVGRGFGEQSVVEVVRVPDDAVRDAAAGSPSGAAPVPEMLAWFATAPGAQRPEVLQPGDSSLKFVLPPEGKPGVYAYRISGTNGQTAGLLNVPRVYWTQGDQGPAASPGGWLQVLGRNMAGAARGAGPGAAAQATLRLTGPRTCVLPVEADAYSARTELPADLPPGEYRLTLSNGWGGDLAGSQATDVVVQAPEAWPQTVLNVRDSGALGDGVKDDTLAVAAALEQADSQGGGIVYFPRGRYRLADALVIPRRTVLRGERRDWVALAFTDLPEPPEALIRGSNRFALEDLTVYARNHRHVIAGDLGDQPEAGRVFLRRVTVRADAYRGHLTAEQLDQRFRDAQRLSTGGGDTVRLGGQHVEITDCDLYGSGRVLFLSRVRGGLIAGNSFYNGRWGWYCLSGNNGLIFAHNTLTGGDLMSTGGGLNCLDGSTSSQNVYFAHNQLRLLHGWDREAMTTDAGGEAYFGKIRSAQGTRLELEAEPTWRDRNWAGAGVFLLAGTGAGQHRRVVRHEGPVVEIDRPWQVDPDAATDVGITMFQGYYLIVDNDFTDTGAVQLYGTSVECVLAGNRGTRMPGFRGLGLWYHGYQPSWYCQFLDNQILEGNYYHWETSEEAFVDIHGAHRPPLEGPLNRGSVVRRNTLHGNAHIRLTGSCRDAVVEGNRVEHAEQGVFVSRQTCGVLVRGNTYQDVLRPEVDEEAIRRAAEERLQRYLGRQEPVAVWSFDEQKGRRFLDSSGNGFAAAIEGGVTAVAGGVRGQAARFDGSGYLRVDEPAVFNAPEITVGLWVKPDKLTGRRGLVAKRLGGTAAPLVFSQNGDRLSFEATDPQTGVWTHNFQSPPALSENQWTHVAVVAQRGRGATIYAGGQPIADNPNTADRATNTEPLILGREAWGGDPPRGETPGPYLGLIDEVRIWTRALSAEEIQAEAAGPAKVNP